MTVTPRPTEPLDSGEPSNRWPWVALALGLLIIVVAIAVFFVNRSQTVNITVESTPTANPVARAGDGPGEAVMENYANGAPVLRSYRREPSAVSGSSAVQRNAVLGLSTHLENGFPPRPLPQGEQIDRTVQRGEGGPAN